MVNFFIICFLLIPWIFIPVNDLIDQLRIAKAVFFDMMCLGMIYFAIKDGFQMIYRNKWLAWLTLWIFFTIFMNWYLPLAMSKKSQGFAYNLGTIEASVHFILGIILVIIICSNFDRNDYIRVAKAICLSSVLVTIYGILQVIGFDPMGKIVIYKVKEINHFSAIIDHPNLLGNYLAASLPFFLFFKKRIYIFGFLLVLIGVLLSKSSLSLMAVLVSMIVYFLFNKRNIKSWLIVGVLFILVIGSGIRLGVFNNVFSGRIVAWEKSIGYIKLNPLFGQGLGIFKQFDVNFDNVQFPNGDQRTDWVFAHNDYLERLCEIGLFGLFLVFMMFLNTFKKFNYSIENKLGCCYLCSFIAFLIIMFGSFPLEIAPLALMGITVFSGVERV